MARILGIVRDSVKPNQLSTMPGGNMPDKIANRSNRFSGTFPSFIVGPYSVIRNAS